jgi:hypothetical protein
LRTINVLLLVLVLGGCCFAAAPPVVPPSEARLQQLIRQLGSGDYRTREEATRLLLQWKQAELLLRRALPSGDAEVDRRAKAILTAYTRQRLATARENVRADGAASRADLLAERLVRWQSADDDDACWQAVLDLGHRLRDLDRQKYQRVRHNHLDEHYFPATSFRPFMLRNRIRVLPAGRPTVEIPKPRNRDNPVLVCLARGERMLVKHTILDSLIATSEHARFYRVGSSIVLCGGSVDITSRSGPLVVVCAGDFISKDLMADSVIVARGTVRCSGVRRCLILAGGDVSFSEPAPLAPLESSTILAGGTIMMPKKSKDWVRDIDCKGRVRDALSPVKFFEPSSLGVEVAPSRYGVRVTGATAGKPFARAGLRVDDLVLALDGSPVRSPDAFRRLLRKRLVEGGEAVLEVRRQGKTVEVRVPALH